MAKKKEFNLEGVLMAAGGGAAANVVMNLIDNNIDFFKDKPALTPIVPSAIGAMGLFFMPENYNPMFYGMIGAAGGELIDETGIFNGLSRIVLKNNGTDQLNGEQIRNIEFAEKELRRIQNENEDFTDSEFYEDEED